MMMSKTQTPATPALKPLQPLVGVWRSEIRWSKETHKLVGGPAVLRGRVSFKWLEDGHFLVQRMGDAARWLIGRDDTSKRYGVLYADSRGVSRVYEMSLRNGVWRIWRKARGFHQRFTGRFSRDRLTVKASWKRSVNGTRWQHDFDVTYTKMK
jgi:hypothetical protein